MKLTKTQIDELLEAVTQDLTELLKSEELSKADPGAQALGEGAPEGSSVAPPAPEGSEDKAPEGEKEESSSAEGSEEKAPEASESSDPAQEESITPEELQAEYAKLPVEELKAHFLACKQALMAVMGGEGGEGSQPPAPPAPEATEPAAPPAPPAPPAPEATEPPPVAKSEKSEGEQLQKAEVESLKKSLEDQGKLVAEQALALERLSKAFLSVANMPLRKSAETVEHVGKPTVEVTLSKSEALTKLNEVSRKADLKKSDRQLINQFALGHVGLDAVAHLLRD